MARRRLLPLLLLGAAHGAAARCRCRPWESCWPSAAAWRGLNASVHGRLSAPAAAAAPTGDLSHDPYWIQAQAGGYQSAGWLGAWNRTLPAYVVAAESAEDVAAAVRFAARHDLRFVVKGAGHDFLSRSMAPYAIMVWTYAMRSVRFDDAYRPAGGAAASAVVHVGAGARWVEVYHAATTGRGVYVQGGGCASVGAAGGFVLGGGYGQFSKLYGTAAGNVVEAEVVLADGSVVVASERSRPELLWALRGGGGATFGVVTRVTMRTHPLPDVFGGCAAEIEARDDAAYVALLRVLVRLLRGALRGAAWGEQLMLDAAARTLRVGVSTAGLAASTAEAAWEPLSSFVAARPAEYNVTQRVACVASPARGVYDPDSNHDGPPVVPRPGWCGPSGALPGCGDPFVRGTADPGLWWWAGDAGQVDAFWYGKANRYLPAAALADDAGLARTLFAASREWPVSVAINKGGDGAAPDAAARQRGTSMHPGVADAAATLFVNAHVPADGAPLPALHGRSAEEVAARVRSAASLLRAALPDAGSYGNEAWYFEPDWQRNFWGASYPRLARVKRAVDPTSLFTCWHCVGSEGWDADGMCTVPAAEGSATAAAPAPAAPARPDGSSRGGLAWTCMPRDEMINRASLWVTRKVVYSHSVDPEWGYPTDCSGFVSWAINATHSNRSLKHPAGTPWHVYAHQFGNASFSSAVNRTQVRAGDVIVHCTGSGLHNCTRIPGHTGHSYIFHRWENATHFWAYEQTETWDVTPACKNRTAPCLPHYALKRWAQVERWAQDDTACEGMCFGGARRLRPNFVCPPAA